ncbi:MAG: hypothetical protein HC812_13010 [Leptolyngbya sp. RL_3_1]|nr:hypothetical protein [Leptolyngbya sp. RL_3_1]
MADYLPIRYLYGGDVAETDAEVSLPIAEITTQLTQALQQMPLTWQQQVQAAAMKGADEELLTLIEQAPQVAEPLAKQLTDWTLNFDFDAIIHLIHAVE